MRPLLVLLALLGAATFASAQYAVSISGGAWDTNGSAGHASDPNPASATGSLAHGVVTGGGFRGKGGAWIFGAGPGTCKQTGAMTATLAWPTGGGPRPAAIVVKETATASWGGNSGACASGLGGTPTDVVLSDGTKVGATVGAVRYSVVQNPGASFTVTCTPSASATFLSTGIPGHPEILAGNAQVSYSVEVAPVTITLSGGIADSVLDRRYLIGQRLIGTVSLPSDLTPTSYAWSVGGGEPFGNWWAENDASHHTSTFPTNQAQVVCRFKKADPDGTVSVAVTATTPPGSSPSSLSFTVTAKYDVLRPDIVEMLVKTRPNAGADALSSWTDGSSTYTFAANGVGIYSGELAYRGVYYPAFGDLGAGIRWDGKAYTYVVTDITDHNPWGGQGDWHFVQTVVPYRTGVTASGTKGMPENGQSGLDTTYPYEPGPYDPEPGSPGAWPCDGSTKKAADAPGQPLWSGYTSFSTSDAFKTWMMYRPPGDGSVFVPVKKISWHWQGNASLVGSTWSLGSTDAGYAFDGGDYPPFPIWTQLVKGGGPSSWTP